MNPPSPENPPSTHCAACGCPTFKVLLDRVTCLEKGQSPQVDIARIADALESLAASADRWWTREEDRKS